MKPSIELFERQQTQYHRHQRAITRQEADFIRPGERFDYRGRNAITYGALYDAIVVAVNPFTITLSLMIVGNPSASPYNWAIQKNEIGTSERLYEKER